MRRDSGVIHRAGGWVVAVWLSVLIGLAPAGAYAQVRADRVRLPDSTRRQIVKLTDGSTLVGRFVDVTGDPVRFETSSGVISLKRASIVEVKEVLAASFRNGRYETEDPNPTRLFFGPTARTLPKGSGDFSDTYLFLLSGGYGVGGHAQIGAGLSVLPTGDWGDNVFFVTGKLGWNPAPNVDLAVGGLIGWTGMFGDDLGASGGITLGAVYGVGTFGSRDHSLTAGLAVPFAAGDIARTPVVILGGETRIGRRVKLVTENYITTDDPVAIFGYGLRIFGEKIAVDLAFLNASSGAIFPGIPYVDFVVRF
jgi:hypothetical protein